MERLTENSPAEKRAWAEMCIQFLSQHLQGQPLQSKSYNAQHRGVPAPQTERKQEQLCNCGGVYCCVSLAKATQVFVLALANTETRRELAEVTYLFGVGTVVVTRQEHGIRENVESMHSSWWTAGRQS